MTEPRMKAELRVKVVLRLAFATGRTGAVLRRGDSEAGGILFVLRGRTGLKVLAEARTGAGAPALSCGSGPEPVSEETADLYLARQIRIDPDLWVIELETPDFTLPFAATII